MANQISASRRPKRSGASSAKDSTLGKKVAVDPRVRVQSLKAARETAYLDDDDNDNTDPSNPPSSSPSSSTAVNSNDIGSPNSSSTPRKPVWKRVPLKRCTPHNMLVKPWGPRQIIFPSVPGRKPRPKPANDDGGDTDKETDTETSDPQPSSVMHAVAQPPRPGDTVATLDIRQTTRANALTPQDLVVEDIRRPSNSNIATDNVASTMSLPGPLPDINSISATPMAHDRSAAASLDTHPSNSLTPSSPERRFQFSTNPANSGSHAHEPRPFVEVPTTNHDFHRAAEPQGQRTNEMFLGNTTSHLRNLSDAGTRSLMDIDAEMGDPFQPSGGSAAHTPEIIGQPQPHETPMPAFGTQATQAFDISRQAPPFPAAELNQFTQAVQPLYAVNGYQGQNQNDFHLSLNHNQQNPPFLSTSLNGPETFQHQSFPQSRHDTCAAQAYSNEGCMPYTNYQPSAPLFIEPQWYHVQLSASAPPPYIPCERYSDAGQLQQPAFDSHVTYPWSARPVHEELLLSQLNPDHGGRGAEGTSVPSPLSPFTRRVAEAAQHTKTSLMLEPDTEWMTRVAEVRQPSRINPFQSSLRSRPMLMTQPGESEPRLYCPLPSRSAVPTSMRRMPVPPVGSEEDLIARLALERQIREADARRALRREKRKSAKRESDDDADVVPVKKQKVRREPTVIHKESHSQPPQMIVPRPAAKPKPVARTRSCRSISNLMKTVLRL